MSKYIREAYKGKNGKWYVHVKAKRGGKIVMDMGYGYTRRYNALNEFDNVHGISDLFLLHNDLEYVINLFKTGRTPEAIQTLSECAALCAFMRDLIERPR